MHKDLGDCLDLHVPQLEAALRVWLPVSQFPEALLLNEALSYAVFPGGKRMRPLATLLVGDSLGAYSPSAILRAASAIEYLHTSSLIFDDLPAMDDAPTRRERLPLHKVYGEGIAVLTALALLNQTYRLMAEAVRQEAPNTRDLLFQELCHCIGSDGMIGGQSIDIASRNSAASPDLNFKTTSLTRLMLSTGAILCHAPSDQVMALAEFGHQLGVIYQQLDDLMDKGIDARNGGRLAAQEDEDFILVCQAALKKLEKEKNLLRDSFARDQLAPLLLYVEEIFSAFRTLILETSSRQSLSSGHD